MATLSLKTPLGASSEDVWNLIGQFQNFGHWHPAVEKCETVEQPKEGKSLRTLHLIGGAKVVEELTHMDAKDRCYRYRILESPLPIRDYQATIRVIETPQGCEVEWSCDFTPETDAAARQAGETIQEMYQSGMNHLRKLFGG